MSEPSPHASKPFDPSLTRKLLTGLVLLIVSVVVLGVHVEQLWLGWLYFLLRTLPRVTVDWPTAILGAASSVLFIVGLHRTVCGFRQSAVEGKMSEAARWTWRTSLAVSALLFVLFASGTAWVGTTHQFIWLLSGRGQSSSEVVAVSDLGVLAQARDSARMSQARSELRQFGYAFENFHATFGAYPSGGTINKDGELLHGWAAYLGVFQNYSTDGIDFHLPWRSPPNDRFYKCQLSCFLNPSQSGPVFDKDGYGLCHWAGNVHVLPIRTVQTDSSSPADGYTGYITQLKQSGLAISTSQITDGTNHTILLGSVGQQFKPWGHPANVRDPSLGINRSPAGFGGPPHWQGGLFLMCDGSVRFLSEQTDIKVMRGLATPAAEDVVSVEF